MLQVAASSGVARLPLSHLLSLMRRLATLQLIAGTTCKTPVLATCRSNRQADKYLPVECLWDRVPTPV